MTDTFVSKRLLIRVEILSTIALLLIYHLHHSNYQEEIECKKNDHLLEGKVIIISSLKNIRICHIKLNLKPKTLNTKLYIFQL